MSNKAGILIAMALALIFGLLAGALINRALIQRRIGRAIDRINPAGLERIYHDALQPDSKESRKIRGIIDQHLQSISELRESFRTRMREEFEKTWEQLEPLLSPDQKRRLLSRPFGPPNFFEETRRFFDPEQRIRRIEETISWLSDKLQLTDDQISRLRGILNRPWGPGPGMHPEGPPPRPEMDMPPPQPRPEDMARRLEGERQSLEDAVEEILDESQKTVFLELKPEFRTRLFPPFFNQGPPPGDRGFPFPRG